MSGENAAAAARGIVGVRVGRRICPRASAARAREHGFETGERDARPGRPVDAAGGHRQRGRDARRLARPSSCTARTTSSNACAASASTGGSGMGSPVSASTVAIGSAVSRATSMFTGPGDWSMRMISLRSKPKRVERVGKPVPHLGNVAHYASLWTMVDEIVVAVTGVSGFLGQRLLPLLDASPHVDRIVGLDVREPARRARKLEFHRVDVLGTDLDALPARTSRRSSISRPRSARCSTTRCSRGSTSTARGACSTRPPRPV